MFPKLFDLGPFPVHTYGLLLATAFLTAISMLAYLAEKEGIPRSRSWDLGFVVILSALLGAKLLMVLSHLSYYLNRPSLFLSLEFWQAGGAFYGGLIGAVLGSYLYLRRDPKLSFWTMADASAPAIAVGQAVGRVGCFAAGCDYGRPSEVPWAVTFSSEYAHRKVGVPLHVALHPVQLYESLGVLLLGLILLWIHTRRRFSGQVICLYFMGYGILRFANEFFRGDMDRGFVLAGMLSVHQLISLCFIAAGAVTYALLGSRRADTRGD